MTGILAQTGNGISGPPYKMRQNELIYWEDTPFNDRFNNTYDSNSYGLQYAFAGAGSAPVNLTALPGAGPVNGIGGAGWYTQFTAAAAVLMTQGLWWWQAILTGGPVQTFQGYISNGSGAAGTQLVVTSLDGPSGISVLEALSGVGVSTDTVITSTGETGGGTGLYTVSVSQLVGSAASPVAMTATTNARIVCAEGQIVVEPDLSTLTGAFDGRSQMQIGLANAEAALIIFQQSGGRTKEYEIGGRRMVFHDDKEIRELCDWFRSRVFAEKSEASGGQRRMIRIGFSPPSSGVPTSNSRNWPWW